MSIIRQRKKNLLVAWFSGVFMTLATILIIGIVLKTQFYEYFGIREEVLVVEEEKVPSIVAARSIEKGHILEEKDLEIIMVPANQQVTTYFSEITMLIGQKLALDIDQYLPLTPPMLVESELVNHNLRLFEFAFVELPYTLSVGDVVDIRIAFPSGHDFVILSKKEVKGYERTTENVHQGLLNLQLEEGEILRMSSALVDTYLTIGTKVYMVKYVNQDQQAEAIVNYPVNQNVLKLYKNNPNMVVLPDIESSYTERKTLEASLLSLRNEEGEMPIITNMTTPSFQNAEVTKPEEGAATISESIDPAKVESVLESTESEKSQTESTLSGF